MGWRSFVALGDSVTEGVGDPLPRGGLRGWATRLAEALTALDEDFSFAKLAHRGLTTAEIRDQQLERALELRPDLSSAIAGMNDAIKPWFREEQIAEPLEEIVAGLEEAGATVLMATLPDVTRTLPLTPGRKPPLRGRLEAANEVIRDVAARHPSTVLIDARGFAEEIRGGNFSIDRMHPNSRGHLLIARAFAERLAEAGEAPLELPDVVDVPLFGREALRHAGWVLRNGVARELARRAAALRRRARLRSAGSSPDGDRPM